MWTERLAQEEGQHRVAQGSSVSQAAEAVGRRGLPGPAMAGWGSFHAFVRGKQLIQQHFSPHPKMIAEARRQAGRAIQVGATRRVLHMEAQGRARVAPTSHAMHHMLLNLFSHRRALVLAQALHRRMHGAAARRHPALLVSIQEPPPRTAAEQAQMPEYAVPVSGAQRVFHLLRSLKKPRSI